MSDKHIIAAGAVVTRDNSGEKEFLLIHRGYRDDWSFPKGKLDPEGSPAVCSIPPVNSKTYRTALVSEISFQKPLLNCCA